MRVIFAHLELGLEVEDLKAILGGTWRDAGNDEARRVIRIWVKTFHEKLLSHASGLSRGVIEHLRVLTDVLTESGEGSVGITKSLPRVLQGLNLAAFIAATGFGRRPCQTIPAILLALSSHQVVRVVNSMTFIRKQDVRLGTPRVQRTPQLTFHSFNRLPKLSIH